MINVITDNGMIIHTCPIKIHPLLQKSYENEDRRNKEDRKKLSAFLDQFYPTEEQWDAHYASIMDGVY